MLEPLFLLLAMTGSQAADPLAPARAGKIECIGPNTEKKTCIGTAVYRPHADGSFDATVTAVVAPAPLITMETRTSGKAENGALCGVIHKSDYEAATFRIGGEPAPDAMATAIRGQVVGAVASLDGKTGCSKTRPDGDMLAVDVTVDGVARPELGQKAIWVAPADGYKLGV
jgi:hypothetical protein